ncbi:hypothetical protein ACSBR1_042736 [Camellia fascicularis]
MPRRETFPAPRASQSLRAGSSQGGNCLPQAPSASQSLRVVSSQETPSYKTVLLSSPSLDQGHCLPQTPRASQSLCAWSSQQGNCLPQAPSASQSLRVGSSPKRPSYKTVLLSSPSLDQGPRASQPLCAGSSQEGNCLPQAPSASQLLRAGSSQERRSYLTVLCSSPSLDQGNCLLQAPSVSQSLHVESSLEKLGSILYSPSLDQKLHVLDQPLVKTVGQVCFRRLAPSTPQSVHVGSSQEKRTCRLLSLPSSDQEMHVLDSGIQYVVEGIWKKFWSGWISSETSLSNERKFLISIYPFGSRDEADAYRLTQYECETGHTVKFYFLDGVNIVIERVQADVHSWIDNKYENWSKNGKCKSRWWDHIRDEFIQIFRNVMVCLRHIYSKRIYSGKLIDGISVINNRETKLIWFVKAATVEEFNKGSRRDIVDLRQLMVEAVLKPYIVCNTWDRTKEQAAIYFLKEGLPNDLCDFIERLYDENFVPMNLDWLLDDPAFWSPDLKLRFFRDLHEIVHDLKLLDTDYASIFLPAKLGELNIANWECLIPQEGRERQVLNKMRHDQKLHNKEDRGIGGSQRSKFMGKGKVKVKEKNQEMGCGGSQLSKIKGKEKEKSSGSGGNKFIEGDIFSEISQFCRNLIEHYNDKLPRHERKPKEEISLIADKIFHGACSMLRNSILEAWMAQPSSLKTERPEYMNRLMTDLVINRRQV